MLQAVYTGSEMWYQCSDIKVVEAKGSSGGSSGGGASPSGASPSGAPSGGASSGGASSFVGTSEVAYLIILSASFAMAFN